MVGRLQPRHKCGFWEVGQRLRAMIDGNRRAYQLNRTESVLRRRDHCGVEQADPRQKHDNHGLRPSTESELGPGSSRLRQQGKESFLGGRVAHIHSLVAINTHSGLKVSHSVRLSILQQPPRLIILLLQSKIMHGEGHFPGDVEVYPPKVSIT